MYKRQVLINAFFLYSFLGWVMECIVIRREKGRWENRGFAHLPFLSLIHILPLAGCAGGASSGISASYPAEPSSGADSGMQAGKAYTVGILQPVSYTHLDVYKRQGQSQYLCIDGRYAAVS